MKLDIKDIEIIKNMFAEMQTRQDLLELLNFVKPFIYGKNSIPFELKQITWYSNPTINKNRYRSFSIKKKSGNERVIHAPKKGLKSIQRVLGVVLQCLFEPHDATMGFVRGKSIVHNAKVHVSSRYVYNIDLRDFFHSIDQARFWKCLQLKPFSLVDNTFDANGQKVVKIYTGIREFITDHGEKIFYKIEDDFLIFIPDKNGNLNRYKERLSEHLNKPIQSEYTSKEDFVKASREYRLSVNSLIFDDAHRYILTEENEKVLKGMVASRLKLANIIASLCCNEVTVERKNIYNEWQTVNKNVTPQGAPTSPIVSNIVCQRLDFLLTGVAKRFGLKYSRYADDITFSSMHNVYQQDGDFIKELNRIVSEQGFTIKESKTRLQKDGYRKEVTGLLVNEKANVQKRYIKQLRMWLYYWERYGYERASRFFLEQYTADKGHVKKGKPDMANVVSGKLDFLKMVKGGDNELYLKFKSRFNNLMDYQVPITQVLNVCETDGIPEHPIQKVEKVVLKNSILDTPFFLEKTTRPESLPQYIDPIQLSKFLRAYNKESLLKYTCHEIDKDGLMTINEKCGMDAFNLGEYQEQLINSFKELIKHYSIPKYIWALINAYLNGGKEWSSDRIKVNWKCNELFEWSDNNNGFVPNPDRGLIIETNNLGFNFIPFRSKTFDTTIGSFSQLVIHFKNLFHIRADNSLKKLIENVNAKSDWNGRIEISTMNLRNNVEFFTDVDKLIQAYKKIITIILDVSETHNLGKPKVDLSLNEVSDVTFFSIHHKNSTYKKTIKNTIERIGQKHTELIKNQINGICDLYIQADFENNEFARINLWNGEERKKEVINKCNGVEYQLIFK